MSLLERSFTISLKRLQVIWLYLIIPFGRFYSVHLLTASSCTSTKVSRYDLSMTSANLFLLQYKQRYIQGNSGAHLPVIVTVNEEDTSDISQKFQDRLLSEHANIMFLHSVIVKNNHHSEESINKTVEILEAHLEYGPMVVMFLSNNNVTISLIRAVCSSTTLKWTHLIHVAEWILATTSSDLIDINADQLCSMCVDFITFVIMSENGIAVSRKARGTNTSLTDVKTLNSSWSIQSLGVAFRDLARPKKIGLQGMILPVGVVENVRKHSDKVTIGNSTKLEGYVITLLHMVASALKFEYQLVTPVDDWNVGSVLDNKTSTGLTGMMARREIAFTCAGMSKTENRLQAIDFVDAPVYNSPIFLTYKLPQFEKRLDLTLIDIVQLDFLLICLGPALFLGVLGAITHVITKSCTLVYPVKPTKRDLRRLGSFPDHACFYQELTYPGQTGRVLRGSWAVFWFIFGAAYSAYLVTSFTVKPRELKLDSMEKVVQNSEYNFGVLKLNPALVTALSSSKDPILEKAWLKFVTFNKSNPFIFGSNKTDQVHYISAGRYALLDHFNTYDTPLYVNNADISEFRSYQIQAFDNLAGAYWTVPKNAFYKDVLNMAIVTFEESGLLRHLREKYGVYRSASKENAGTVNADTSVPISRILILIYVCGGGVVAAVVSLVAELLVHRKFKSGKMRVK